MGLKIVNIPPDVKVQWELTIARFEEWIKGDVFKFHWWSLLLLFIICSYAWWKLVDKSRF